MPPWEKTSVQQYLEAEFQNALAAKFTKEEHLQVIQSDLLQQHSTHSMFYRGQFILTLASI